METMNHKCARCLYNDTCIERSVNCPSFIDKDSVSDYAIASGEIFSDNTIAIGCGLPKIKSHLTIGNMIIHNTHHFNWLHRKMWKLLLGFNIENVEE